MLLRFKIFYRWPNDGCQRPKHVVLSKKERYLCSKDKGIFIERRLYSLHDYMFTLTG